MANSSISRPSDDQLPKLIVLCVIIVAAMATLVCRLAWLQILQSGYYKAQAVDNSTRVTFLRAPRGVIYDRHGNLLATNKQSLSMIATPIQIDHVKDLADKLAKVLDKPEPEVLAALMKAKSSNSPTPIVIERDLDVDTGIARAPRRWASSSAVVIASGS